MEAALTRSITAYVFVNDAHPADLERIFAMPREDPEHVHSAVRLVGTWDAMVVLTVDRLDEIDDLVLRGVRGGESPMTQTAIALGTVAPPGLVTWTRSPPVITFSRIRVRHGRVQEAMEAIAREPSALGVVAVAGAFDVLAEFGGETFEDTAATVEAILASIDAIASSDTAFATKLVHSA